MDSYITGNTIKKLREKNGLTQNDLAHKLGVTSKAVSKWETGRGLPDVSLLEPISKIFGVSLPELFSGNTVKNNNLSANMFRSGFYVCPVCGNIIFGMGESLISCHGITLPKLTSEERDLNHFLNVECVEDEYFVSINHEMTKKHYISFICAVSDDRAQIVKLYPEGKAEARFKRDCVKYIYYYCNVDGLFRVKV